MPTDGNAIVGATSLPKCLLEPKRPPTMSLTPSVAIPIASTSNCNDEVVLRIRISRLILFSIVKY